MPQKKRIYFFLLGIFLLLPACVSHIDEPQADYTIYGLAGNEPFLFFDPDGKLTGFNYDLIAAIAQRENFSYQYKYILSYSVENIDMSTLPSKVDAFMGMTMVEENKSWVDYSLPFYNTSNTFAIKTEDTASIKTLNDLTGKCVSVLKKSPMSAFLDSLYKKDLQLNILYVDTTDEIISKLMDGTAQACFAETSFLRYQIKKGAALTMIGEKVNNNHLGFALVNRERQELLGKFNNGYAKVFSDGTYNELLDKYFSSKDYYDIALYYPHPPFSYINEEGDTTGIDRDIIQAVAQKTGMQYRITYVDNKEVVDGLLNEKYDAAAPIVMSEDRRNIFDFTLSYATTSITIAVKSDNTDIENMRDLSGKIICVEKESKMDEIISPYQELLGIDSIIRLKDTREVMQYLLDDKAMAGIVEKPVVNFYINKDGLLLKTIYSILYENIGLCVKKGFHQAFLTAFNSGLADLINEGEYDKILQKYPFSNK